MDEEEKQMMRDMLWLNAVIATELIQVTENTSKILRKEDIPKSCRAEHNALRDVALKIADRYKPGTDLCVHLGNHR
ncbi:hypothetical protein F1737_01055 [Methanoplanus sp. FWC-SCC4]|uniref:Uncharacterized protein n=1 Tax=Methanochimaera problematica TaxID=2609417 RepID=A0AA97FC71_9EURY|nr:hypothetical protein [Methanoplanus sp. FWC-SCC4]WOF15368.1 hypothetical protein F1737_01055 [Methanoplanus sp. FWC-SCC4]